MPRVLAALLALVAILAGVLWYVAWSGPQRPGAAPVAAVESNLPPQTRAEELAHAPESSDFKATAPLLEPARREAASAERAAELPREDARRSDLEIVFERGSSIAGLVLWPDGTPAEAEIELTPRVPSRLLSRSRGELRVTSDASGRFEVDALGAEAYHVQATATSNAEAVTPRSSMAREPDGERRTTWKAEVEHVAAGTNDLVLTLAHALALSGRVRDDRGPVSEFRAVVKRGANPRSRSPVDVRSESFEDEEGLFEFDGLVRGEWEVTVYAKDHARSQAVHVTLPAPEPIELFVPREARVRGVALDAGGAPLAGVSVLAERADEVDVFGLYGDKEALTDERGAFELRELAPGPVRLRAFGPAGGQSEAQELALLAAETIEGIELRLRTGAMLIGEVIGRDGRGVADVEVSVLGPGIPFREPLRTDAQGRFEFAGLPAGEVYVRAKYEGLDLHQTVQLREGQTTHARLAAPDTASVRLTGRVLAGGEGLGGARLNLHMEDDAENNAASSSAQALEDGSYELTLPGPGRYSVTVSSSSASSLYVTTSVEVPAVTEHALDITIPLGRISGRVTGAQGGPLSGVSVRSQPVRQEIGASGSARTLTDAEGRYELDVPAGTHALEAGGPWQSRLDAARA